MQEFTGPPAVLPRNHPLAKRQRIESPGRGKVSKFKFISNLSILDLLFNMGPKSINYLTDLKLSQFHSN